MSSLGALQADVRRALVVGDTSALVGLLRGGTYPERRLAVHQRHYRASLATSLLDRFPATVWLVGSDFVVAAAEAFVGQTPPSKPCIAEYGDQFPAFLGTCPGAGRIPYLVEFATLEWHLARLALAIDGPAATLGELRALSGDELAEATVGLQPGVHYMETDWAIDELIAAYLSDQSPASFVLQPGRFRLELRGVRGQLRIGRLEQGDFAFRSALAGGAALADAAASASHADPAFDPGQALLRVLDGQLIAALRIRTAALR